MSFEDSHWLPGLHQQGLVIFQLLQRTHDGVITTPVARGLAGPAVDNQVARVFADFFVEIIHQHAHRRFLLPPFAGDGGAARRADGRVSRGRDFRFNRHR